MTPDQKQRLDDLEALVVRYSRAGKTYGQFWDEFHEAAGDLEKLAFTRDDNELSDRYFDILDGAHEGYGGPPEQMDQVME